MQIMQRLSIPSYLMELKRDEIEYLMYLNEKERNRNHWLRIRQQA